MSEKSDIGQDSDAGQKSDVGPKPGTGRQGFASMDRAKQRAIASMGGKSVPSTERSFSRNPKLAAEAGRKGGMAVAPKDRSFARNTALAAKAGRKGGEASHAGRPTNEGGEPS